MGRTIVMPPQISASHGKKMAECANYGAVVSLAPIACVMTDAAVCGAMRVPKGTMSTGLSGARHPLNMPYVRCLLLSRTLAGRILGA